MSARTAVLAALLLAVVASAIGVVHARQQARLDFAELSRLEAERDELGVEYGRLQLEQATLADNKTVDRVARERLGLVTPAASDRVVIRR